MRVAFATDSTITSARAIFTTFRQLVGYSYTKIDTRTRPIGDERGRLPEPSISNTHQRSVP
jgi:hypothetical protein